MSTVLVTGASSGIGKETALRLLGEGYSVYAAARRVDEMSDLDELGAAVVAMDVTREDDVVSVVRQIEEEAGGVDILINNAGFGLYGAMEDTPVEDARRQFEVNLFGPARLTQLVLPHMRRQGKGRIVNVSSMGGRIYTPLGSWYHASKHALEGWSDCLRLEVKGFGIDVIIIEPGVIETSFGDVMVEPMLERSGSTAYAELARRVARATVANYAPGRGSPPSLIAGVISRALRSHRPRTRYVAGKYARPMIGLRRTFGDKVFDRVVMRAY